MILGVSVFKWREISLEMNVHSAWTYQRESFHSCGFWSILLPELIIFCMPENIGASYKLITENILHLKTNSFWHVWLTERRSHSFENIFSPLSDSARV